MAFHLRGMGDQGMDWTGIRMKKQFRTSATRLALTLLVAGSAPLIVPNSARAQAMDGTEARLRRIETELRAVQRKVFPDGAGKTFGPEIAATGSGAVATGTPATSAVTDLLTRMDAMEAQMQRLTAQSEESQNRMSKLEARLAALEPPVPAPVDLTAAASSPQSLPAVVSPASKPAPAPAAVKPAARPAAEPSADRVAAVQAIVKPSSDDKGEDEYSYGYRLWEAKFFPEAQQQLQRMIAQYPKHARISYARNLLGRAYLDDNKPGTAAQSFVQNYLADKQGDRAADSLLYLGVSMAKLKENKRACAAFAEFKDTYSAEAAGRLKAQYEAARKSVTCN